MMKSALLIFIGFATTLARADFCSLCDSIRNTSQPIPLVYEEFSDPETDDSQTEASLPGHLRPRRPGLMKIQVQSLGPTFPPRQLQRPPQVLTMAMQAAQLINSTRRRYGLADLQVDPRLNQQALVYAKTLFDNYNRHGLEISHDQAGELGDRLRAAGIRWGAVGENIARGHSTAHEAVTGWLNSVGHRQNLLAETPTSQSFRRHGIAEYNGFWVNIFTD